MKSSLHRFRAAWLLALIATVLNAAAPVLAYAEGQLLDFHAGGMHAAMHPAGHMHGHGGAAPEHGPATPPCPYGLDFAAGAALAPPPPLVATPPRLDAPLIAPAIVVALARPSLRLAFSRAPPDVVSV
jgi:hypothetical protein